MCDVKQLKTEENNSTDVHGPQQINHHVLIQSETKLETKAF